MKIIVVGGCITGFVLFFFTVDIFYCIRRLNYYKERESSIEVDKNRGRVIPQALQQFKWAESDNDHGRVMPVLQFKKELLEAERDRELAIPSLQFEEELWIEDENDRGPVIPLMQSKEKPFISPFTESDNKRRSSTMIQDVSKDQRKIGNPIGSGMRPPSVDVFNISNAAVTDFPSVYTVCFDQTLYNTSETNGYARITLVLSNSLSCDIAVEVFNTNITACGESVDYDSGPYTITFPAGATSVTFDILVTDDNKSEANEHFNLTISLFSLPAIVTCAEPCNATVTIADNDGVLCLGGNNYIFIGNGTKIEKSVLSLTGDTKSIWQTLMEANSRPLGIDVDITTCTLFYSVGSKSINQHKGEVYAVNLTNNSRRMIHSGLKYPSQISVNWITQKLYWCDTILSTIEYSDFDGGNRQALLQNINGMETIALDPCSNDIYWVSKGSTYVIYKMKLDGTEKRVIVSSDLAAPNSLAIDFISSKLYWTDGSKLQRSNFEGGDRSTVYTTEVRRATGISFYNKTLYWAEWKHRSVKTCTVDGTNVDSFVSNVKQTAAIHVMDWTKQLRCC